MAEVSPEGQPTPRLPRYGAKALILEAGRLLCLKKQGDIGLYYVLPGGGQHLGELLPDTLARECREELGARIAVGRFRFLQEYVGVNHGFRDVHGGLHFVNAYFECRLLDPPGSLPQEPDFGQVGWEWLPVADLTSLPLYPKVVAARMAAAAGQAGQGSGTGAGAAEAGSGESGDAAYLGDSV